MSQLYNISVKSSTPDFIAYREADCQIDQSQIGELLEKAKIFHTTCFALSKKSGENHYLGEC
jgi:fructokinase